MLLMNPQACVTLHNVGVDVIDLIDLVESILYTETEGQGAISFGQFSDLVLQLRGTNSASVRDIVELRTIVRKFSNSVQEHMLIVASKMDELKKKINPADNSFRLSDRDSQVSMESISY